MACPLTGLLQGEEGSDDRAGPLGPTGGTPAPPWEGSEDFPAFSPPVLNVPASEVLALRSAEEEVRVCITKLWCAMMDMMRDDFLSGCPRVATQCVIPPSSFTWLRGAGIALPDAL